MIGNIIVLIDAENVSYRFYAKIYSHLKGVAQTIDWRVYGDWSSTYLRGWKNVVLKEGLKAVHQFNTRKNCTDFELVMDAIEMLHKRNDLRTFCIVSSDSDYTSLCLRLKGAGKNVIVIGEKKAPPAYQNSCSYFHLLDNVENKEKKSELQSQES